MAAAKALAPLARAVRESGLIPEPSRGVALVSGFEGDDTTAVQAAYPGSALYAKNEWRLLEYLRCRDDGDVLGT